MKCYNVYQLVLYNVARSDNKMATVYETLRNFTRFMTAFEHGKQSACFDKRIYDFILFIFSEQKQTIYKFSRRIVPNQALAVAFRTFCNHSVN